MAQPAAIASAGETARAEMLAGALMSLLSWWMDENTRGCWPAAMDDLYHQLVWRDVSLTHGRRPNLPRLWNWTACRIVPRTPNQSPMISKTYLTTLALLGTIAIEAHSQNAPPTGFPATCAPREVQVMLLGTYHFANPGQDAVKQQVDDVLTPKRQAELEDLVARLARWNPDQIAVEWPFSFADSTQARYERYRAGTLAPSRNEVVQIGFRLAARLGQRAVHPIDYQMTIGNDSIEVLARRRPDLKRARDSILAVMQKAADSAAVRMMHLTIIEHLRDANTEKSLHAGNSLSMFGSFLPAGDGDNYGGPQLLARWYERNFMIAHHLTRILRPDTKRVLVIVGSGHVPALRNILDEAPQFCPLSPLPYLG